MRSFVTNPLLLNAADASTTQTSAVLNLNQIFAYSLQLVLTGTVHGTAKLQASVDHAVDQQGNVTKAGNWSDITNSSQAFTAAGGVIWEDPGCGYPFVRAVWTSDGGSGSRTVTVTAFVRGF